MIIIEKRAKTDPFSYQKLYLKIRKSHSYHRFDLTNRRVEICKSHELRSHVSIKKK